MGLDGAEHDLRAFVPEAVARRAQAWVERKRTAWEEHLRCTVLVADLSGFTALTERLADEGPAGAETLSAIVGDIFGRLADEVAQHRGDVLRYVGDAAICIWEETPDLGPEAAVQLAAAAGLAIQRVMHERSPIAGEQVSARVAIAEGRIRMAFVGGADGRFETLADGDALLRAALLCGEVPSDRVGIDDEAVPLLNDSVLGPTDELPRSVVRPPVDAPGKLPRSAADPALVIPFVPRGVRKRIDAQLSGWIAEFRLLSVVFLSLPSLRDEETNSLADVNAVFGVVQNAVNRFGGSINKFFADEKGHLVLAVWGLPHAVHEDGPARAGAACVAIRDALAALELPFRGGITTGRVFCGLQGGAGRLEYAVLGRVINLAARLMGTAPEGSIVCDEATAREARARLETRPRESVEVKGFATPVAVHSVEALRARKDDARSQGGRLLGREKEIGRVRDALRAAAEGRSSVVILEGDPGIGKSRLIEAALRLADGEGVVTLQGRADAIERTTPMFPWREVFASLLHAERGPESLRAEIEARLAGSRSLELAPLLRDVLTTDLPETDATRQLTAEGRADATLDLMAKLLADRPDAGPLLLILDDGHWFDSASWALAELAARVIPACALLLATRPMAPEPASFERILATPGAERVRLAALGDDLLEDLLQDRLAAERVDPNVVRFVRERSGGNPFFAEQIASTLSEREILAVENGRCFVRGGVDLAALDLPARLEGLIASRIDGLQAQEQLTLKVASVVGRSFPEPAVEAAHPVPQERPRIPGHLHEMTRRDLIEPEPLPQDPTHRFRHVVLQQVAYNLLSFAQRAGLHRSVARWIEARHAADTTPFLGPLAHHWVAAGDVERSIHYLELAGEQALRSFANHEAVLHFEEAIRIGAGVDDGRRAHWHSGLATARLKLADYEGCASEVDRALELRSMFVARSRPALALSLAGQFLRQAWHRLRGGAPVAATDAERERLLQAAALFSHRAEYGFFNSDPLWSLYGIVSNLNLAERGGGRSETAEGYAGVAVIAGIAGINRLARYYSRLAIAAAANAGQSATIAFVHELLAVYHHGQGEWDEVESNVTRAIQMFDEAGDGFRWEGCLAIEEMLHLHRGNTGALADVLERLRVSVFPTGVAQNQAWCAGGLVALDLLLDAPDASRAKAAEDVLSEKLSFAERIFLHGVLAAAWNGLGDRARARDAALSAAATARERPPAVYYLTLPLLWCAETLGELSAAGDDEARRALVAIRRALRGLARLQSVAKPAAELAGAMVAAAAGRRASALRAAGRAEAGAAQSGLIPVELAARRTIAGLENGRSH
ncbi:MAG: AAA family ATPase [bacterium]|nr:AAA family ATPase [bacterium]